MEEQRGPTRHAPQTLWDSQERQASQSPFLLSEAATLRQPLHLFSAEMTVLEGFWPPEDRVGRPSQGGGRAGEGQFFQIAGPGAPCQVPHMLFPVSGCGKVLLRPRTSEEVSHILR